MFEKRLPRLLLTVAIVAACSFSVGAFRVVNAQDDESKGIQAEEFITKRPAKNANRSSARYKPKAKPAEGTSVTTPPPGMAFAQLGLTTWRFRPSTAADKTKELVEEDTNAGASEWTLERVEDGTPLAPGQRVRLSIESLSRDGYLYVIDREQYADGSLGEAHLIFPTRRTADANHVKAGRLIYIPGAPRSFRVKPSQNTKTQVAEVLTILVSPQPLIGADKLSSKSISLPREQVDGWEKQWGSKATKFEMEGGAGQTMTDKEQAAGKDSSQELGQDDPVPQTIYRVAAKPENPVVITVPLKFAKTN